MSAFFFDFALQLTTPTIRRLRADKKHPPSSDRQIENYHDCNNQAAQNHHEKTKCTNYTQHIFSPYSSTH
nr:MAG TPA: hypothetical protein [Caudoviricetes sp.]